jgi:hypothetical protein
MCIKNNTKSKKLAVALLLSINVFTQFQARAQTDSRIEGGQNRARRSTSRSDQTHVAASPTTLVVDEVRAEDFESLAAAVASIGSAEKTLVVTTTQTIKSALTIPANVSIVMRGEGMLKSNATLIIEGCFDAPLKQVLARNGAGTINIRPGKTRNFFPEWFGAKGNANGASGSAGGADDTAALQASIEAVGRSGGTEIILLGAYRITSTLDILNHNAANNGRAALRFVGTGTGDVSQFSAQYWHSALVWDGKDDGTLLNLHSRGCQFQGIVFAVAAGKKCGVGVDIDRASGAAQTDTAARENVFSDCLWIGARTGGVMTDGLKIGNSLRPANNDFMRFSHCSFVSMGHAGVFIAQTDYQAKHHTFTDCSWEEAPYGIYCDTGSFETEHCGFYNLSITAIHVRISLDHIVIRDTNSETCAQFYNNPNVIGGAQPLTISGGRISLDRNDGKVTQPFIRYLRGGVLTLQGVVFDSPYYPNNNFLIQAYNFQPNYSSVVAIGNIFPNNAPFKFQSTAGDTNGRVTLIANNYLVADGMTLPLDDLFLNVNSVNPTTSYFTRLGVQTYGTNGVASTTPLILGGATNPEGVIIAPPGSIFLRSDGGAGATFYVKESGTGAKGWIAK